MKPLVASPNITKQLESKVIHPTLQHFRLCYYGLKTGILKEEPVRPKPKTDPLIIF